MSDEKNNPITYKEAYEILAEYLDSLRNILIGVGIGRDDIDFQPCVDQIGEVLDETAGKLSVECQLSGK